MRRSILIVFCSLWLGSSQAATLKVELLQGPDALHLRRALSFKSSASPGEAFRFGETQSPGRHDAERLGQRLSFSAKPGPSGLYTVEATISGPIGLDAFNIPACLYGGPSDDAKAQADEEVDGDADADASVQEIEPADCLSREVSVALPSFEHWSLRQKVALQPRKPALVDWHAPDGATRRLRLTLLD